MSWWKTRLISDAPLQTSNEARREKCMKTEFEFRFEARGFHFAKEHKYAITAKGPVEGDDAPAAAPECRARIVPSSDKPPSGVEQMGSLFITVPYPPEKGRDFARYLSWWMTQQIMFRYAEGDFRIHGGILVWKRIPETPEEEAEIGDRPHGAEISMVEDIGTPAFDGALLPELAARNVPPGLLAQFNESKLDANPIRRFLGFFRILEGLFVASGDRAPLKDLLRGNETLRAHYVALVPKGDFDFFIKAIVAARHRCAHLKLDANFGFVPGDPRIEQEIRPHLPVLEALAYECLISGPKAPGAPQGTAG
jgi:hypothetical protein